MTPQQESLQALWECVRVARSELAQSERLVQLASAPVVQLGFARLERQWAFAREGQSAHALALAQSFEEC